MSNREEMRARNERRIFNQFIATTNLRVDTGSIQSEKWPKPDISCAISGQHHYFELTEITDEGLARNMSCIDPLKPTGGAYFDDRPLLKAFSTKSHKTYISCDGALELLAYYDKQYPPLDLQPSIAQQFCWMTQDMILRGPWSRLWIYDSGNKKVLWMIERE
ncbi:MAG TPA: hypothetical protein VHE60_17965 [Pyrinomonadaceae bacterium]|nr:hypothetical protein [Pyrinomonadaceae bacterium]